MESQSQKIIKLIEKIIQVMKISTDETVLYYHDFFVYTLDQLHHPHDLEKIAENILRVMEEWPLLVMWPYTKIEHI